MKRCPECRRDYYDDSLLYCLDDGTALWPSRDDEGNDAGVLFTTIQGLEAIPGI